jgi:hypothetical protein
VTAVTQIPVKENRHPKRYAPRAPFDVRELARTHTKRVINVLAKIAYDEKQPGSTRVAAIGMLLERGWGKVAQPIASAEHDAGIEVVIRHLVEPAPKTIEHKGDD